jgi:hypothetical protein
MLSRFPFTLMYLCRRTSHCPRSVEKRDPRSLQGDRGFLCALLYDGPPRPSGGVKKIDPHWHWRRCVPTISS